MVELYCKVHNDLNPHKFLLLQCIIVYSWILGQIEEESRDYDMWMACNAKAHSMGLVGSNQLTDSEISHSAYLTLSGVYRLTATCFQRFTPCCVCFVAGTVFDTLPARGVNRHHSQWDLPNSWPAGHLQTRVGKRHLSNECLYTGLCSLDPIALLSCYSTTILGVSLGAVSNYRTLLQSEQHSYKWVGGLDLCPY